MFNNSLGFYYKTKLVRRLPNKDKQSLEEDSLWLHGILSGFQALGAWRPSFNLLGLELEGREKFRVRLRRAAASGTMASALDPQHKT